jgi:hypothetical protein
MSSTKEYIQRDFALFGAAERLGLDPDVGRALPFVNTMTKALVGKDLIWEDVPDKYGLKDMMPGLSGKITLVLARRSPGFKLFEEVIDDPIRRAPLLQAYEDCLRLDRSGTSLSVSETFEALHLHRPPTT